MSDFISPIPTNLDIAGLPAPPAGGPPATIIQGLMPDVMTAIIPATGLYDGAANPLIISPIASGLLIFVRNNEAVSVLVKGPTTGDPGIIVAAGSTVFLGDDSRGGGGNQGFLMLLAKIGSATGGGDMLWFPTRAAAAVFPAAVPVAAWIEEVQAIYVAVPGGVATPNAWTIITAPGGQWQVRDDSITLPIRGGGLDDGPNYAAAVAATVASGIVLRAQAGAYIFATIPQTPSYAKVRGQGRQKTFFRQTLTSGTGIATVASISAIYTLTGAPSTLSATSPYGANIFFSNASFAVGTYVMLRQAGQSFRWAIYKILRVTGVGPYNLFVDAPNLLGYTAGDAIQAVTPVIGVEVSGITFQGTGSRYIEILGAIDCHFDDVEFDSVSFGAVSERFISIDVGSRNCTLKNFSGNGNLLVPLGTSMESCYQVEYCDGEITQCTSAAHIFQDATDCFIRRYSGAASNVGVLVSHALVNTLGTSGCGIEDSTITYNVIGVDFDVTCRDCWISGSDISDNSTRNVSIDAASIGTHITNTRLSDSPIAIFADVNCQGIKIHECDTSNSVRSIDLSCEMDVDGLYHNGTIAASPEIILVRAGGILRARGLDLQTNAVSFAIQCAAGGIARVSQSVIRLSNAGSAGIIVNGAAAKASVRDTKIVQSVAGCFGLYAQVGTLRYDGIDADGCTTPIFSGAATGIFDHFQVVATGAVAVVVTWPDLKTGEKAFITRTVDGGVPGVSPKATYIVGTSITVTSVAGDTSTYDVVVK